MSDTELIERLETFDRPYLDDAERLAQNYYEENGPVPLNLEVRIETAAIMASQPLTETARKSLLNIIKDYLELIPKVGLDETRLKVYFEAFLSGKFDLFDLFKFEIDQINALNLYQNEEGKKILPLLQRINIRVYDLLKDIHEGDFRADALSSLDKVIDDAENEDMETAMEAVLLKIKEVLSVIAKFKSVRLIHIHPDPYNGNYVVHQIPKNTEQKELEINPYKDIKWEPHIDKDLVVDYVIEPAEDKKSSKFVCKLSFGKDEFGYLEYEFDTPTVHQLVKTKCAGMSAMVDTFLNSRLKKEVAKLIEQRKRELLKQYQFKDWWTICKEMCKFLSKVINMPIALHCKNKPGEKEARHALITDETTDESTGLFDFMRQTMDKNPDVIDLNVDLREGEENIGFLIAEQTDKTRKGIIKNALSFLQSVIKGREETRHWVSKLIGAAEADFYLDGKLEELPTPHPVVVLYSDIDDYTRITNEFKEKNPNVERGIDLIMSEFIAESKILIENKGGTVDKYVGDEVITLIGPPFTKDGKDAFGNTEPDYTRYIKLAYEIAYDLQDLLDKISQRVQEKEGFVLQERLVLAHGCGILEKDPVGPYGDVERPGAGVDYTMFGNEMNKLARVLASSKGGQFLMPENSFDKFEDNNLVMEAKPEKIDAKGFKEQVAVVNIVAS